MRLSWPWSRKQAAENQQQNGDDGTGGNVPNEPVVAKETVVITGGQEPEAISEQPSIALIVAENGHESDEIMGLIEKLQNPENWTVRRQAALSLGHFQIRQAIPWLERRLRYESDKHVRIQIERTLAMLKRP